MIAKKLFFSKCGKEMVIEYVKQNMLIVFIAFFAVFYVSFIMKNSILAFFMTTIIVLIVYIYLNKKEKDKKNALGIDEYISKLQHKVKGIEIDNSEIFKIHKAPDTLKYIMKNDLIKHTLYEMRSMLMYDKGSFLLLIAYIEYYLKFHYYVMIERYQYDEYVPILKDIRREIMNISKSFIFNSPDYSIVAFDRNIKAMLERTHNILKAYTYKLLGIVRRKYDKLNQDMLYAPPWDYMSTNDIHMLY